MNSREISVICPRCGHENPFAAMNCANCKINLDWAMSHTEEIRLDQEERKSLEQKAQIIPDDTELLEKVRLVVWIIAGILMAGFIFFQSFDIEGLRPINSCFGVMIFPYFLFATILSFIIGERKR